MKDKSLAFKVPSAAATARARSQAPENLNPYDFAVRQFDRAADHLGLNNGSREVLRKPINRLLDGVGGRQGVRPGSERAATGSGRTPLTAMASRAARSVRSRISSASCSTQPGCG